MGEAGGGRARRPVEWLRCVDRQGGGETNARTQFPHNLKREIRDRCWTEGRIAAKNHRMPDKQRPNKTVADT